MRTVADKIIVEVSNEKEQKLGSIFLVGEIDKPIVNGMVVAVGPEVKTLRPHNKILFERGYGVEISKTEEKILLVLREENVLAVEET